MIVNYMSEIDAKEICGWEYPDEYKIYNIGSWDNAVNKSWAIANEQLRKEQFRSIYDNNQLLGYFRFKKDNNKIILGLGIHPNKCGKGIGKQFMTFILNTQELKNKLIELEVREFNKRAINCYQSVGFKIIKKEEKETIIGKDIFVIMQNKNI